MGLFNSCDSLFSPPDALARLQGSSSSAGVNQGGGTSSSVGNMLIYANATNLTGTALRYGPDCVIDWWSPFADWYTVSIPVPSQNSTDSMFLLMLTNVGTNTNTTLANGWWAASMDVPINPTNLSQYSNGHINFEVMASNSFRIEIASIASNVVLEITNYTFGFTQSSIVWSSVSIPISVFNGVDIGKITTYFAFEYIGNDFIQCFSNTNYFANIYWSPN